MHNTKLLLKCSTLQMQIPTKFDAMNQKMTSKELFQIYIEN